MGRVLWSGGTSAAERTRATTHPDASAELPCTHAVGRCAVNHGWATQPSLEAAANQPSVEAAAIGGRGDEGACEEDGGTPDGTDRGPHVRRVVGQNRQTPSDEEHARRQVGKAPHEPKPPERLARLQDERPAAEQQSGHAGGCGELDHRKEGTRDHDGDVLHYGCCGLCKQQSKAGKDCKGHGTDDAYGQRIGGEECEETQVGANKAHRVGVVVLAGDRIARVGEQHGRDAWGAPEDE